MSDNIPAFPTPHEFDAQGDYAPSVREGMTLRDAFAIAALTGLLGDSQITPDSDERRGDFKARMARSSYSYADAMLKARAE